MELVYDQAKSCLAQIFLCFSCDVFINYSDQEGGSSLKYLRLCLHSNIQYVDLLDCTNMWPNKSTKLYLFEALKHQIIIRKLAADGDNLSYSHLL